MVLYILMLDTSLGYAMLRTRHPHALSHVHPLEPVHRPEPGPPKLLRPLHALAQEPLCVRIAMVQKRAEELFGVVPIPLAKDQMGVPREVDVEGGYEKLACGEGLVQVEPGVWGSVESDLLQDNERYRTTPRASMTFSSGP